MTNKGPRCSMCNDFVEIATTNANGQLVCPDCRPDKFDGMVRVLPRGRAEKE